jgi:hypothetical protein
MKPGSDAVRTGTLDEAICQKERTMENTEKSNGSLFKKVIKWVVIGFLAIIALRMVFGLLGFAAGLTLFLIFRVGPLALVIWLGWKAWKYFTEPKQDEA